MSILIMPETNTTIQIKYKDNKTAVSIQKAISPDNLGAPDGMHIITMIRGNVLEIEVYTDRKLGSLISTLDDLLSCINAAETALEI
jgi:hypothetical protein